MIFENKNTVASYEHYPIGIKKALNYLENIDLEKLEVGDHPIEGTKIFAKIFDLTTQKVEDTHPEVHKDYIDLQYWQNGSELFGIAPYLGNEKVYEERKDDDLYFLEKVENESFVTATPGCFAVFFPWDAHRPGIILNKQATFRKCVIKIHVDALMQ